MRKYKPMLVFACWFVVTYGLLIAPWPSARPLYATYFKCFGRAIFKRDNGKRLLDFQPLDKSDHRWPSNFDTAIVMGNKDLLDANGKPRRIMLAVDAWQMGWIPTAFFLALTLATPIPWRRRWCALAWGWLWIQGWVALKLGIFIWYASPRVGLVVLSPFWADLAARLKGLVMAPVGPGFFVAAFFWLLVTFRRQDLPDIFERVIQPGFPKRNPASMLPRSPAAGKAEGQME
jgi:hypothetical protein